MSAPAPEECFLLVSVARGILGGGRATRPPVGEWDPKLSGGGETRIFLIYCNFSTKNIKIEMLYI